MRFDGVGKGRVGAGWGGIEVVVRGCFVGG